MPLLAQFIGVVAGWLFTFFSRYMLANVALKVAAASSWLIVIGAFVTSTLVCVAAMSAGLSAAYSSLGAPSQGNWPGYLTMGIGMVIPAEAPAIFACLASIWIATSVLQIQRKGIENFGK